MTIDSIVAGEWVISRNAVYHLILPASLLGYYSSAYLLRMPRSFMIEHVVKADGQGYGGMRQATVPFH
ncbi:MAG TPA: hypothetical protein VJ879_02575 [Desulfobacter sp.]|nr:hypothetical protein [Desulfobacter sp.]